MKSILLMRNLLENGIDFEKKANGSVHFEQMLSLGLTSS
jgi:hypothetical protein